MSIFRILIISSISLSLSCHVAFALSKAGSEYYEKAYTEMADMLDEKNTPSIKRAVFLAEWAYLDGNLDYEKDFCEPIQKDIAYMKRWMAANNMLQYKTAKQITLCNFFFYPWSGNGQTPFRYDFDEKESWDNQLVSRVLKTHKGQCYYASVPNITLSANEEISLTSELVSMTSQEDFLLEGTCVMQNGQPARVMFEGGYCNLMLNPIPYYYYVNDHLGNVREVVSSAGIVMQVNNYYPFGTPYFDNAVTAYNPTLQPYKYNGKEWDHKNGLYWYDYGARMYDPVTLTWDRMDPLCEKYYNVSPYCYCGGNPVNRFDPDGSTDYTTNKQGDFYDSTSIIDKIMTFFGFGPEHDRIYAEETEQLLVSIPLNSIAELTNDNVVSFEILDSNTAEKVYNAVRNYSNVEWAMIKHGKKGSSTLLNKHDPTSVESELLYKYEKEYGQIIMTHNHVPVTNDVNDPGYYFEFSQGKVPRSMPSKEYFDVAKKHPKVTFRQTYKNSNKVNYYDGEGLK